jgi:hypothetical protein
MKINFYLCSITISIIGIFVILNFTKEGMGISPDSIEYIYSAKSLMNGQGLRSIHGSFYNLPYQTHFPPVISILYAGLGFIFQTDNLLQISRYCNAFFLSLTLLLISHLLFIKIRLLWIPIITQIYLLTSIDFIKIYLMTWSEPLFIPLMILSLWLLSLYIANNKTKYLILSAILISIASITRYVGITLIISGLIIILTNSKYEIKYKIINSVIFGFISSSLLGIWIIRNYIVTSEATDRNISFHPMNKSYLFDFLISVKSFIFQYPTNNNLSIILGLFICLITSTIVYINRHLLVQFYKSNIYTHVLIVFSIVYFLFLIFSNTFLDFTPFYFRIIIPLLICIFLCLIFYINYYIYTLKNNYALIFIKYSLFIFILIHIFSFMKFSSYGIELSDYSNNSWENSQTIKFVKRTPQEYIIYTSEPDAIYFLTNRSTSSYLVIENDYRLFKNTKQIVVVF